MASGGGGGGGGGGFLTPQVLPSRSSIVTSTPFPGQNVSSLPFTPARPSLQSPLHQPVQPLFTQPTALRQLSTRPLAQASHLSNIRNEPLLESDEDDYETSSHDSERKSPRYGPTKDSELAKTKTVAAVSTGQPVIRPPQSRGGEETPTSRPPSLAVRKKRGSASVRQSAEKAAAESSSSSDDESSSSDSESGSSSSGSESSSENET